MWISFTLKLSYFQCIFREIASFNLFFIGSQTQTKQQSIVFFFQICRGNMEICLDRCCAQIIVNVSVIMGVIQPNI